jgi:hypothetical protein
VQLVLGTDYTVSYLNNTTSGVATAVVTGINGYEGVVGSIDFIIHAIKLLTTSYNLTQDEDWTGFESISVYSAGVTLDLKGHKLTITGLDGAGRITDSIGGGELHYYVPAVYESGYAAKIEDVSLLGGLKLVKEGPGTLAAIKAGQAFTGGTVIAGGILRYGCSNKDIDTANPFGHTSENDMVSVTIEEGGILDPAGSSGWGNHMLIVNGGMVSNTVAWVTTTYGVFNPKITVNADFTFATMRDYGWTVRNLGGHTVTIYIAPTYSLYVATLVSPDNITESGRFDVAGGGYLRTLNRDDRQAELPTIDLDGLNGPLYMSKPASFHDYRPTFAANAGTGTAALNVYGTFTPDSLYFYGPTMQDGSTIDLSAKTGAWSVTSSLTAGGNRTTQFAAGAKVKVELGARALNKGEKVIAWTTQPDATTFSCKEWTLESRSDGLYVVARRSGSVYYIR